MYDVAAGKRERGSCIVDPLRVRCVFVFKASGGGAYNARLSWRVVFRLCSLHRCTTPAGPAFRRAGHRQHTKNSCCSRTGNKSAITFVVVLRTFKGLPRSPPSFSLSLSSLRPFLVLVPFLGRLCLCLIRRGSFNNSCWWSTSCRGSRTRPPRASRSSTATSSTTRSSSAPSR